jgi:DNA mismatch repair protein MutS2
VLESLVARGGAVACTTHYERLKVVALADSRFKNASVGFDLEAMAPTFRLVLGVPGASSALIVARRFGIPEHIVERAEGLLSKETSAMSDMVRKLEAERIELENAREAIEKDRAQIEDERAELDVERQRFAKKESGIVDKEASGLIAEVRSARDEVRAAKTRLRSAKLDARELAALERQVDRAASAVSVGGRVDSARTEPADRPGFHAGEVAVGMRVFVPRLRTDAEVLEVLGNGQLRVAAGPLKLLTSVAEVRKAASGGGKSVDSARASKSARPGSKSSAVHSFDAAADADVPIQTSDNTVDLRGLRSHEAIAISEQFLDRCIGASKRVAFLIHGHGTGALRQSLRDMLRASPYVERSRPGEPREGGDGVTVVWLK